MLKIGDMVYRITNKIIGWKVTGHSTYKNQLFCNIEYHGHKSIFIQKELNNPDKEFPIFSTIEQAEKCLNERMKC